MASLHNVSMYWPQPKMSEQLGVYCTRTAWLSDFREVLKLFDAIHSRCITHHTPGFLTSILLPRKRFAKY